MPNEPAPEGVKQQWTAHKFCGREDSWFIRGPNGETICSSGVRLKGEHARLIAQALAMLEALRELLGPLGDAFCDEECDADTQLGGYIFGDVMQDAYLKARTILSQIEGARHG